jgi:hypothetical protein
MTEDATSVMLAELASSLQKMLYCVGWLADRHGIDLAEPTPDKSRQLDLPLFLTDGGQSARSNFQNGGPSDDPSRNHRGHNRSG